jgi:N-acetylmuramoyl-L-alanine amidase
VTIGALTPRALSLFSAATLALAAVLFSQTAAPSLTVLSRDGRRALPLAVAGDQELVALDDVASAFQLAVQESLGAITVSYKGRTIVLTPDQTLASVSGRLISLPAPPTRSGRRWLVPVEFLSRALALVYDQRLDLRKPSRLLIVGDLRVPRIAVRYEASAAAGRLIIDATPRTTAVVSQDNDRLTVKFDADALDAPAPLLSQPALGPAAPGQGPIVQAVRSVDAVTLAVDLGPRFGGFKATSQTLESTLRLVVDISATQVDAPQTAAPPPPSPSELPPALAPPIAPIRTVVIDPGHGGEDEGAKGASGIKEKDLTLAVARRARAVVEARLGVRVLLTRDDDRNVPLDDRTALANNNKADLFVSLHANASMRPSASGAAVFCSAFDEEAMHAASTGPAERLPTFGGGLRDIELVPWNLAQTRHLDQSSAFATMLQQQMRDRVPLAARSVERASLRVLESANMPAVLVELGYLSNSEQEKLLASDAFQATFVQTLYEAIVKLRDALAVAGTR